MLMLPLDVVLFICFFVPAAGIGFAWDGEQQGWIRAALPPQRMLSGAMRHFQSAIFEAWQLKVGLPTCGKEIPYC